MLGRVSAAGAGGDGGKADTTGATAAAAAGTGARDMVDGAAGAASALGAKGKVWTGTLSSRSGLGDSLGVGTDFRGIGVMVRSAGGLGAGCGAALGCDQETSWTDMGGVSTGVGGGDTRIQTARTARIPISRTRASRKTTALGGCGLGWSARVLTAAHDG